MKNVEYLTAAFMPQQGAPMCITWINLHLKGRYKEKVIPQDSIQFSPLSLLEVSPWEEWITICSVSSTVWIRQSSGLWAGLDPKFQPYKLCHGFDNTTVTTVQTLLRQPLLWCLLKKGKIIKTMSQVNDKSYRFNQLHHLCYYNPLLSNFKHKPH